MRARVPFMGPDRELRLRAFMLPLVGISLRAHSRISCAVLLTAGWNNGSPGSDRPRRIGEAAGCSKRKRPPVEAASTAFIAGFR
jgi:hypothetical protein